MLWKFKQIGFTIFLENKLLLYLVAHKKGTEISCYLAHAIILELIEIFYVSSIQCKMYDDKAWVFGKKPSIVCFLYLIYLYKWHSRG